MAFEKRIVNAIICGEKDRGFSEFDFRVEVVEEDDGDDFVEVSQDGQKIGIEPSEWPVVRDAIDQMISKCREHDKEQG